MSIGSRSQVQSPEVLKRALARDTGAQLVQHQLSGGSGELIPLATYLNAFEIKPEMFQGATDTLKIQAAIDYAIANSLDYVELEGAYTVTNLTGLDQVRLISKRGNATVTIGADLFIVPTRDKTVAPVEVYINVVTGNDSTNCGLSAATPVKTFEQAKKLLPHNYANTVVFNFADGTHIAQNGTDEWGRAVLVDLSDISVKPLRDSAVALNTKDAKVILRGASEAGTILDGATTTARYGVWGHSTVDIQIESMTVRNCHVGITSHQNGDITLIDVTTSGNTYGRFIESNSRMEVIRGSNITNTYGYYMKNGQLQENDSTINGNTQNEFVIDGNNWIKLLRVSGAAAAGKNYFNAKGKAFIELDDCDISGGNSLIVGVFGHMHLKNGTRLRGFTSSVWGAESGYVDVDGLCHIHNNTGFIVYSTRGKLILNLDNCDSLNASAVDEPNTNGVRFEGSASSCWLDSRVTVTSADKILSRPTSGLIFKGTAPPSVSTQYYERGAMCLNEAAAVGQPAYWIVTTKGYGGTVVWTAGANL
jgi:hypothetical protein